MVLITSVSRVLVMEEPLGMTSGHAEMRPSTGSSPVEGDAQR
jgi:hypothetical protein